MPSSRILRGNKIAFKANWRRTDDSVVKSVAKIVLGAEEYHVQPDGYKWALGTTNDWWMDKDPQTGEFILAWRYGGNGNTARMQLLYHVILWRLGFEHFNEKAKTNMSRRERLEWLKQYFMAFLAEGPHDPGAPSPFDKDVFEALGGLESQYAKE